MPCDHETADLDPCTVPAGGERGSAAVRLRARGLGYVGAVGLLAFLISAGVQITRLETGWAPTASIVGWPLGLLVIGIAGLAAPALYRRDS